MVRTSLNQKKNASLLSYTSFPRRCPLFDVNEPQGRVKLQMDRLLDKHIYI